MQETHYNDGSVIREIFGEPSEAELMATMKRRFESAMADPNVKAVLFTKLENDAPCFCGSGEKFRHCHGKILRNQVMLRL